MVDGTVIARIEDLPHILTSFRNTEISDESESFGTTRLIYQGTSNIGITTLLRPSWYGSITVFSLINPPGRCNVA